MQQLLKNKIALITGASRGIGEAIAHLYAENGAHVIVSSRSEEGTETVAKAIRDKGGKAEAMVCHNGDKDSRSQLIANISKKHGKLDILINNAAANPYFGNILDTGYPAMVKTIEVNIEGYFHMSQLAGQLMRDNKSGCIINTASINGKRAGMHQGIYSISKAAIISMTESFAKECAQFGIRVNAILPGLTDTKFASALTKNEAMLKTILPQIPMHRVAQPNEISPAYLFLASNAASYITGISLPVDGGFLA
ncbi:MAG: glucose 1-dehydrogenase [Proteobacteria bacterium]|nr:glucose 1-dehydrogenase [Pseudomonadota bacterium]